MKHVIGFLFSTCVCFIMWSSLGEFSWLRGFYPDHALLKKSQFYFVKIFHAPSQFIQHNIPNAPAIIVLCLFWGLVGWIALRLVRKVF